LHATFTGESRSTVKVSICDVCDRLQAIHPKLPLRTMPLRIRHSPAMEERRLRKSFVSATDIQNEAFKCWQQELEHRFTWTDLQIPVGDVELTMS
jgi:hypothetical protein